MSSERRTLQPEGGLRTDAERAARLELAALFSRSEDDVSTRLDEFPKYVRRQRITRLLALYELYKRQLSVKGSVIECGVFRGFGVASFAHFSAILEPANLTRRIYGFDSFSGFTRVSDRDATPLAQHRSGELAADTESELRSLFEVHDSIRFLGHISKVQLIAGDACDTIPRFVAEHPHVVVSLLFLDFDLYEPTAVALEHFIPRMPKNSILAFDELDNPLWPGETLAALEKVGLRNLELRRFAFDPYISYARLG